MKNRISRILFVILIMCTMFCTQVFAAKQLSILDTFDADSLDLSTDGHAVWELPAAPSGYAWKRFGVQLLKRVSTITSGSTTYSYKTFGSIKYVSSSETSCDFSISSVGYYQFQIRGEDLEGNYGPWKAIYDNTTWSGSKTSYPGVSVTEDDISAGGSSSGSGSGSSSTGPGIVQQSTLPAGYQYAVIGPNGQIMYYYGGNTSTTYDASGRQTYVQGTQQYGNGYYGPGYALNGTSTYNNQTLTPNTGVSNYPQVTAPNTTGTTVQQQTSQTYTQGQTSQTNPNYYSGSTSSGMSTSAGTNMSVTPQITQGLEIGWHVDTNGRFYYQGNGQVLKGTWYLIDGSYYRFGDNGYLLANQWYKDPSTGAYYYLSGDGKMLTGWQCLNGTWYYFKPENGNGYGTMYSNTSLTITSSYGTGTYAFDANGAMVKNAWFGGFYYGNDGKRTS